MSLSELWGRKSPTNRLKGTFQDHGYVLCYVQGGLYQNSFSDTTLNGYIFMYVNYNSIQFIYKIRGKELEQTIHTIKTRNCQDTCDYVQGSPDNPRLSHHLKILNLTTSTKIQYLQVLGIKTQYIWVARYNHISTTSLFILYYIICYYKSNRCL